MAVVVLPDLGFVGLATLLASVVVVLMTIHNVLGLQAKRVDEIAGNNRLCVAA